jgi:hypothetical protein
MILFQQIKHGTVKSKGRDAVIQFNVSDPAMNSLFNPYHDMK